jgi:hypothetical protein
MIWEMQIEDKKVNWMELDRIEAVGSEMSNAKISQVGKAIETVIVLTGRSLSSPRSHRWFFLFGGHVPECGQWMWDVARWSISKGVRRVCEGAWKYHSLGDFEGIGACVRAFGDVARWSISKGPVRV